MKKFLFSCLLALSAGVIHADETPLCDIHGHLKMRPVPNADGDEYGDPAWPEKIHLYPASDADKEVLFTLPDDLLPAQWDYLGVHITSRSHNGRFPVEVSPYGAARGKSFPRVHGWLDAQHIDFALQSSRLYAKPGVKIVPRAAQGRHTHPDKVGGLTDDPNYRDSKTLDLQGEWLSDVGDINLRDCLGAFVQIDYRQTKRRSADGGIEAIPEADQKTLENQWATGVCGILETTCDMPDADDAP